MDGVLYAFYDLKCKEYGEEFNIMAKISEEIKLINALNVAIMSWSLFSLTLTLLLS